jgi:hypothetical protein
VITEQFLGAIALSILTAFALFAVWWQNTRAETLLERWCRHTGFDLLRRRYCWIPGAPYTQAVLTGQWVYRVSIRNRAGRVRHGTVCVGSRLLGVLADEVDVRWDA